MPNPTLATLGSQVKKHRGNKTLRDAAKEIGIGAATLMRVEAGRVPDLDTFGKICKWLKVDPGGYLGFPTGSSATTANAGVMTMSAHFRADVTPNSKTAQALATMIMLAVARQKSSITNGEA
ncbi:MAG TPA: helix-turn-helix transcriptional regulator [Burkholderiales bacterium]|nr:helix-turn-helix transcriptional regulator [Burkholderiales bacterium]